VLESDFLPEFLVALVLASQTDVIVVHAAAASIGGAGALITGGSHAGKTTLAVQLAARGHQVLGDETAVLRSATNELLPLPRSVNLRPGPRDASVIAALDALGDQAGPPTDLWSSVIRMGELFPSSRPDPVELRAAFLLDGFTDRASVVPYEVNLDDEFFFMCLAGNETAYSSWGTYVERRAARLLALKRILERCPFWRVEVGPPDETAELIEHTLEGKTC
jgi:hypothetical protein